MTQSFPTQAGVALVFPGQGAQVNGMARDFYEAFSVSRHVFEEASDALSLDLCRLCFEDDPRLQLTAYTQPALLTAEMAMLAAIEHEFGMRAGFFGGHSLGEYTALCAAGVFTLSDAVRIVRRRGELMQSAVAPGVGAMAAVIAPGITELHLAEVLEGLLVDLANHNASDQIVLSGSSADLEIACARLGSALHDVEHRIVPLQVSAPFHSRMIQIIADPLRAVLEDSAERFVCESARSVVSNESGGFHEPSREALIVRLVRQAFSKVAWVDNMCVLSRMAARIYEVGPGRTLRAFFKSTLGLDVSALGSVRALRRELTT